MVMQGWASPSLVLLAVVSLALLENAGFWPRRLIKIGFGDCDFIFLLWKHKVDLSEVHRDYRNPTIKLEKKNSDFLAGDFWIKETRPEMKGKVFMALWT